MSRGSPGGWLAVAATVAMAAAVGAGFWILGTPGHQRDLRLDAQRVQDLRALNRQILLYWHRHQALPPSLARLDVPPQQWRDPRTHQPYAYAATGPTGYRLCATFRLSTPGEEGTAAGPARAAADNWRHPAGRHCFERSVKP